MGGKRREQGWENKPFWLLTHWGKEREEIRVEGKVEERWRGKGRKICRESDSSMRAEREREREEA